MTNEIKIFENPEFGQVRTIIEGEKMLFCGVDVAKTLGYRNLNDALSKHCKGIAKRDTPTSGGVQVMSYIPEGDVYRLIIRSKLPAAERFEHWVFDEVLPSIRKHGVYMTEETLTESLARPESLMTILQTLLEEKQKTAALETKIESDKPKVQFADAVYDSQTLISIGDLAKLLHANGVKIGQKRLYDYLREKNFLCKRVGDDWNTPTQRYLDMGLFEVKEFTYTIRGGWGVSKTTKVTGKGQTYLVNYILAHKDEINSRPKMKGGA